MKYTIQYTDINTIPILIDEGSSDSSSTDITLFGRTDLEYGAPLDSDMLHILEHFSCPAIAGSTILTAVPDLTQVSDTIALQSPTGGELWYNSTHNKPYVFDNGKWVSISTKNDYGANWGIIFDGNKIPPPASQTSGYVFSYSECIMSVAPSNMAGNTNYMICTVDPITGMVTMKYQLVGGSGFISTQANYLIIGMRENVNFPPPTLTPPLPPGVTPSPTITPSSTPASTLTPTPTPTITPGASPSPTPSPTPSPLAGTTITPTISLTPSQPVAVSVTPFPTPTPSSTATITPTVTPSKTPVQPLIAPVNTTTLLQAVNVPYTSQQIVTATGVTVTPSGGISPYTYAWNFASGQATNVINGTTTTPSFSAVVPCGHRAVDSTWKCTVTDSVGVIAYTPLISVTLRNESTCPGLV